MPKLFRKAIPISRRAGCLIRKSAGCNDAGIAPYLSSVTKLQKFERFLSANPFDLHSQMYFHPKAAKLSGVRTDLVMLAVYTNMAFLATIAGFVVAGRLNAASPKAGTGYELDAIAACTIGGAGSASGTIMGSIIGATVMAILNNGMSILGIGTDMQQVIKGCILLLAVTFDIYSKTKSKK